MQMVCNFGPCPVLVTDGKIIDICILRFREGLYNIFQDEDNESLLNLIPEISHSCVTWIVTC